MRKIDKIPAEGRLVVISGPSGVGKGTLVGSILDRVPNIFLSISATTRPPRPGEVDGVNYFFLSADAFARSIKDDAFLEWANIYGDLYATPKAPIYEALAAGKTAVLEIDVQGAMQVQRRLGNQARYVFIMPPSVEELKKRLRGRKTESAEAQKKRMDVAREEMALADRYDYVIINDDLDRAANELLDTLLKQDP